jgi:predicted nucleic acid-binding protein
VGRLDALQDWFPTAFAPAAVYKLELEDHASSHRAAREIINAGWLTQVDVEDPEDLAHIAYLREERWKSGPTEDRGEAEVVVACRRYGWTAIMEDEEGRRAAGEDGVPCAYMLEILLAAAAQGMLTRAEAWGLHCELERERRRAILMPDEVHRAAFDASIASFRKIWLNRGEPDWPKLLATPKLTDVIKVERRRN